jgi:NitT/TauT family transport system permease protein
MKNIVPSPIETFAYIFKNIGDLGINVLVSLYRIFTAILITIVLGFVVGIGTARNKKIDQFITPLLYTLFPIPKIAFLPLLMLFLGLGDASKIALVSLILFFQISITIRDGVKKIHPSYFLSIKSLGGHGFQVYKHVILPAILPNLFTSIRVSIGISISVLFFAENYATNLGIGYFIMDSWLKLDYTAMFSGIVLISLMGTFLFNIIDILERKICVWN